MTPSGNRIIVFPVFLGYVPERERKGVDMVDDKFIEKKISEGTSKPFSKALQDAMRNMPSASAAFNVAKGRPSPSFVNSPTAHIADRSPSSSRKKIQSVSDIGVAIRTARKSKSHTQQEFADFAGVGRRFLSELESGKPTLEIGKVLKVAAAAGIQLVLVSKSDE
jgi:y4mF family transcriptional regulator